MTRQQRHLDELRALCASGRVARAIDLAFEHVASFGPDEQVVALLAAALERDPASAHLRARLAELPSSRPRPGG